MTDKQVAIITGAASGLGLEMAKQLAGKYQLFLIDRDQAQLHQQTADLSDCQCFICDLADSNAIDQVIEQISQLQPDIALLINNAGITHRSLAKITAQQVIEKVMRVDYFAPVQLTQGLLPLLVRSQAKVVNISSMAGWMPVMARAGYCAAKSAMHQYFETFRAEMAPQNIEVLMVYPSFIDTPIEQNALSGTGDKTRHARSTVGKMRSSQWMVKQIVRAIQTGKQRLFPDKFTYFSSLLYRFWPSLYMRMMTKRFASELEVR
ncbi:SDR family NAD(P)-dependent oxidoreductase [Neptunicella sp. SCSIO 80796]|uniref:SDR family NAD(P)-dependent oxidoreductase n=1 Tax=Neptunicella plasticusilytica TaxID=3117012 RepID=UPI003A4E331D